MIERVGRESERDGREMGERDGRERWEREILIERWEREE